MLHSKASLLSRLLHRFQPNESTRLLILAVMVGLATGIGIWVFRLAIELFHEITHVEFLHETLGAFGGVISLGIAGYIVGWMMDRYVGEERHHGVAGIMEAVALAGGRLRYRRIPIKALASAISLGAGASVGPEDPSVQIGSNIGSFFGQRLGLSEDRVRLLVAAGAAGAIAAAFEAPIAGVFFALEVVLGEFTTGAFGVVVLAAVISSVFMQAMDQVIHLQEPALNLLNYTLGSLIELPIYVVMGLLLAPVAALFIKLMYWTHDWFHENVHLSRPVQTGLVGVLVGVVGIFLPEALGPGREAMNAVLIEPNNFTLALLLALGFGKIALTTLSMAGGFVGGVFAPTLFVGLMLGGAFGRVVESLGWVGTFSDPQVYAIVGMAAMMAGVVRSPITAIMLVFELTNDYRLIVPIMLTSVVCILLAERFVPQGIYALGLARKGVHLNQGRDIDITQGITVGEAMISPAPTISETASLLELRDLLRKFNTRSLCVVDGDEPRLTAIVTLTDLQRGYELQAQQPTPLTVADICTREVISAHPDDVLWTAIRLRGARGVGRLPVVKEENNQLVGMLSRHDIVDAYNTAIARKMQDQHHSEQVRLNALTGAHVVEMRVGHDAPVSGKFIRDVQWPAESVVASIRRKGKLLVPHGSTELKDNDMVTIVAAPEVEDELTILFGHRPVHV